ncbi:MAG: cytochrome P460 family protein [Mariniblastus sp.]
MQAPSILIMRPNLILQFLLAASFCVYAGCGDGENSVKAPEPVKNSAGKESAGKSSTDNKSAKKQTSANEATENGSASNDSTASARDSKSTKDPDSKIASKKAPEKKPEPPKPMINNPDFHKALDKAVADYLTYGMVNSAPAVGPEECRAPADEPRPSFSQADDETAHGKKLYFLFAKDIGHYLTQDGTTHPVGQTLVKESWTSVEANPNARNMRNHASANRINPRAKVGDKLLQIGERKALFVMTKLEKDTPETDQGWVYGVVEPSTKKIIASGTINSCMQCHEEAKNDRLFGPVAAK